MRTSLLEWTPTSDVTLLVSGQGVLKQWANTVQLYSCLSSEVISLIIDWTVILRGSAKASAFIIARCTEGSTDYLLQSKIWSSVIPGSSGAFCCIRILVCTTPYEESRERAWNISPLVHYGSTQGVPEWPQWTTVSPVSMVVLVIWTWPYRKVDYWYGIRRCTNWVSIANTRNLIYK